MIMQTIIFLGVFGAVMGSFANMLIHRLPISENIVYKRSFCPKCQHPLSAWALIPILSYLFLLGKCHYCKARIPIRYLICEILSSTLFIWCWLQFGNSLMFYQTSLFLFCMLVLFFTDLETYILPDVLTIPLIPIGIIFAIVQNNLIGSIQGLLIGFLTFFIIAQLAKLYYKKEAMGGGDIKLAAAIGAYWGVKIIMTTIYLSFLLGGIVSITLLLLKLRKRTDNIPFGPYIILGFILALIWGNYIWKFYFG
jgi:leader peptidase (prepilin peptidase) / N-methyltransferase